MRTVGQLIEHLQTLNPDENAPMLCPRCLAPLASLLDPCRCGLAFKNARETCKRCATPMLTHRLTCPIERPEVLPCPLCGGKRHRKMPGSVYECAWRQWENEVGGPMAHTDMGEQAFLNWRTARPNLMAGSVHAERLIRQRKRAEQGSVPS